MKRKRKRILLCIAAAMICMGGCQKEKKTVEEEYLGESIADAEVFPVPENSFVGDPMPFYDNGKMNIFFLDDLRDGKQGYHPWSLYTTENFSKYEYQPSVIPYGDSLEAQDIALGTGSVVKDKDGTYHAFYTGHNDTYEPKEAIMHASSRDMKSWTKIPEDTFYSSESYSRNDFRDPYVFYVEEKQEYWMLITTRKDNMGVIARYVSKDLKTWEDQGVFFENDLGSDSNLECPSLVFFQEKWYLAFSDQWPDRVVHYRVSDSVDGPFQKLETDTVDSTGFYAGRLETDGEHLFVVGWNATKDSHMDENNYNWAGNLIVHELIQKEDKTLYPKVPESLKKIMNHEIELRPEAMTESIGQREGGFRFSGKDYEIMQFKKIYGSYRLTGTIKKTGKADKYGIVFNIDDSLTGGLNLVFDEANGKIGFYNTSTKDIYNQEPQSVIERNTAEMEEIPFTLMVGDSVVSLYVGNETALTARAYQAQGNPWGFFGIDSSVEIKDLQLYK